MLVNFPHLVQINSSSFRVIGQSSDSMTSISGATTFVATMGARWSATLGVQVRGAAAQLQFAAFLAGMEGHLGTTLVPTKHLRSPFDRDGHRVVQCDVANITDAETAEHWGLMSAPTVMAKLSADAALRATQVSVDYSNSVGIRPGHFFQIGSSLCRARLTWELGGENVVQFMPPLRETALENSAVILDVPRCKMRLTNPMDIEFDDRKRSTQYFNLKFEEVL